MGLSTTHLIIFLVIIIVIFGTKKLRNIGSDLGGAVKGFKDGMKDGSDKTAEAAAAIVGDAAAQGARTEAIVRNGIGIHGYRCIKRNRPTAQNLGGGIQRNALIRNNIPGKLSAGT